MMKCCNECGTPLVHYKKRGNLILECPYCGWVPNEDDLECLGGFYDENEKM